MGEIEKYSMALYLFLIVLYASAASAKSLITDKKVECVAAGTSIYRTFEFSGTTPGAGSFVALCNNPLAVLSIYATAYAYCSDEEISKGISSLNASCMSSTKIRLLPESAFAANLTLEARQTMPVFSKNEAKKTETQTAAFIVDQEWFKLAYETQNLDGRESRRETYYGFGMYSYWGVILFYGMIQRAICGFMERRRGYVYTDAERNSPAGASTPAIFKLFMPVYAFVRKHLITHSPLPPYHRRRFLGCTIPTRAESLAVYGFWVCSIVLCAVHIEAYPLSLKYPLIHTQVLRHLADRTGTLAYFGLPLMWIFSGRNNIFLALTGWHFGTFNLFHRHIARIVTAQAIIHGTCWSAILIESGKYSGYLQRLFFCVGIAALIVMSTIVFFSFSSFRQKLYESFLMLHIIFSALLLAFLYNHTIIFGVDVYNYPFLMSAMAIWGFDRLLRIIRQLYCNIYVGVNGRNIIRVSKAVVSFDEASDIFSIDVNPANTHIFTGPGQHYYLYQPFRLRGWENHPFTLASWSQKTTHSNGIYLNFLVQPYDGWTKNLRNQCLARNANESRTPSTSLLLEGPYGKSEPLHTFDEVLLIAGGTGIAATMPYLLDHVRRTESAQDAAEGRFVPTRTRSITLIWTARREAFLRKIATDSCLTTIMERDDVHVRFHLTGPAGINNIDTSTGSLSVNSSSGNTEKSGTTTADRDAEDNTNTITPVDEEGASREATIATKEASTLAQDSVVMQIGRPDVKTVVQEVASTIYGSDSRLAVMVCGPASLSDDVRYATAQAMERSRDSIELFEEAFGW